MTNNSQAGPAIALAGVNLSLGQGAARVHILKDIDLHIGSGEAIGLVGPSGSGKSTLLMVMAGLERAGFRDGHRGGREPQCPRRGRAGPFPRAPCGHCLPVVPPDPDNDRAGKRGGAARIGRRRMTRRRARATNLPPSAWRAALSLSGRAFRRRAATCRGCARAGAQSGDRGRRRTDRKSRRGHRQANHRSAVCRPCQARHDAGACDA